MPLGVMVRVSGGQRTDRAEAARVPRGPDGRPALTSLPPLSSPALVVGGVVGILSAVFLVLLLVYRMKKKDEGSYDLGKKPIYKKAPTNEFYA